MRKPIYSEVLSPTLTISECHRTMDHPHGFWLYDKTRGMNLAMGSLTRELALIKAIDYYQKRLSELERSHSSLNERVQAFVIQFEKDVES